jgi:hypothetical protein
VRAGRVGTAGDAHQATECICDAGRLGVGRGRAGALGGDAHP